MRTPLHAFAPYDASQRQMEEWLLSQGKKPANAMMPIRPDAPPPAAPDPMTDKPAIEVPEAHDMPDPGEQHAEAAQPQPTPAMNDVGAWLEKAAGKAQGVDAQPIKGAANTPKEPNRDDYESAGGLGMWLDAIGSSLGGRPIDASYYQGINDRGDRKFAAAQAGAKDDAEKQRVMQVEQAKQQQMSANRNPGSPQSQARRAQLAPMLKEQGFSDAEIAGLSADDLKDSQAVMGGVAKLRQTAAERTNKLADTQDSRDWELQQHQANRDYDIAHPLPGKHKGGGGGYGAPAESSVALIDALRARIPKDAPDAPQLMAALDAAAKDPNPKTREAAIAKLAPLIAGDNKPPKPKTAAELKGDEIDGWVDEVSKDNRDYDFVNPEKVRHYIKINPRGVAAVQDAMADGAQAINGVKSLQQMEDTYSKSSWLNPGRLPGLGGDERQTAIDYDNFTHDLVGAVKKVSQATNTKDESEYIRSKIPGIHDVDAKAKLGAALKLIRTNISSRMGSTLGIVPKGGAVEPGGTGKDNETTKTPAADGGAARMRTVVTPSGASAQRSLTDAQAQSLAAKGFKVE